MTASTLLPWLPAAPEDFNQRLDAACASPDAGLALRFLAGHRLSERQLARLARRVETLPTAGLGNLASFHLGILSNATTDLLAPPLVGSALRHGVRLSVHRGEYGQALQDVIDPGSAFFATPADAVLLAFDYRGHGFTGAAAGDAQAAQAALEAAVDLVERVWERVRAASRTLIVQTVAPPVERLFGSAEETIPGTPLHLVRAFNQRLATLAAGSDLVLLDVAGLAEQVGLETWHNPFHWYAHKLPFCPTLLPLYADHLGRLLGALRGKARRCLVLDLDNTLWGGVVADDGVESLVLGQGSAQGEAFVAIQSLAKALNRRGIVLAVSSKNNEAKALDAFRRHPEMVLCEDDIAVFQANWHDKASNLEAIAASLNLGLDALAFLDDNPAERAQVREALPQVAVPELPADNPALYPRLLSLAGYFETPKVSGDDFQRAAAYQANAKRAELEKGARDMRGFLQSLQMRATLRPFDAANRPRIVQLINKSNQFNLTTRRYLDNEVAAMEADPALFTWQVRLTDRFGDNGMISVVVVRKAQTCWDIDTWLMSCRVLGRGVERMVLEQLVKAARQAGAVTLTGSYLPTPRNGLVSGHYPVLGFSEIARDGDAVRYALELERWQAVDPVPIEVDI